MRLLAAIWLVATAAGAADFSTYIGDSHEYQVAAIATDIAGNTYVTGSRLIVSNYAPPNTLPNEPPTDVFVTKLDVTGRIVFTTTFGGKGLDQANAIALDHTGNIWVAGSTSSANFPLHNALQTAFGGRETGFLAKLGPDGTVIYSSYFGGSLSISSVNGVATDLSGNVYVTGVTNSSDFPTTPGMPSGTVTDFMDLSATSGAFVAKLDATGQHVLYSGLIVGHMPVCAPGSTCFLSARNTSGVAIAVDDAGVAYVAGNTNTSDLPVTAGVFQSAGYGAFAAKIQVGGNGLVYLSYVAPYAGLVALAPTESVTARAIATDGLGNAYLTGYTNDPKFPASSAGIQMTLGGYDPNSQENADDAFLAQINSAGIALGWATFLGGPGSDQANSLSVDASGRVWMAGTTAGGIANATTWGRNDIGDFLAEVSPRGSTLLSLQVFPSGAVGQGVAVDASGRVHVAGGSGAISAITPAQPLAARVFGITNAAAGPFSGRLSPGEVISIYGPGIGPPSAVLATPDIEGLYPKSLGGVQVSINGVAAPLLYVSDWQINAQVPYSLTGANATVQIANNAITLPPFRASVDPTNPAIFQNADGSARAINQDGSVNSASHPAKGGSIVSIWVTGTGGTSGVDGQVSAAAEQTCYNCAVAVNGLTTENGEPLVVYAGAAPGMINGVSQINFKIPAGQMSSPASVELIVGARVSPTVTVYMAP